MLTPAIILNNSPVTCGVLPVPTDAMLILPGLAVANVMNSGTVLAGTDRLTSKTFARRMMGATGAMSRMKLKLSLS